MKQTVYNPFIKNQMPVNRNRIGHIIEIFIFIRRKLALYQQGSITNCEITLLIPLTKIIS
jgi:hypothetical protein